MATLSQMVQIAQSSTFQSRVLAALETAAVAVYNEDGATAGHQLRAAYARQVLNGAFPLQSNGLFAITLAVLTNPTIAGEANGNGDSVPDGDIQFQVNSIWNALAGA